MYSDEQLIRDYLSGLTPKEINNSVHLIDLNFERDSLDDIINAVLSLYLDVAATAKMFTGGSVKGAKRDQIVSEQEAKMQILNKLIDYAPIANELSKKLNNRFEHTMKQAS